MTIGVLGGGQLGRMLALAGLPLGLRFSFVDPSPDAPACDMGALLAGPFDEPSVLDGLARRSEVVTYEFESVPAASVRRIAACVPVHPPPKALEIAQDRLKEKTLFERVGLPVSPFAPVSRGEELPDALKKTGLPAVIKTRRLGYDGRGQIVLRDSERARAAFDRLGGVPAIVEGFVEFDRELSMIAVRATNGTIVCYPLVENHHRDGILRMSRAPAPGIADWLQAHAERYVRSILEELSYVGVLAVEFFLVGERLLGNEMAPRVHNSAHWTIEGAACSQFENHLRAICGLPLGSAAVVGESIMFNLIGELPELSSVLAIPGAHVHLYGKRARPGRKLGHITMVSPPADAIADLRRLLADGL